MPTLAERIQQTKPFESDAQEALLALIVAAAQVRDRMERLCRPYGVGFAHYNVLRILQGAPAEGHPRCAIIERMLDPAPDVTRLIDPLVERGLVQRSRSEVDRRMTMHRITDEGRALLRTMHADVQALQDAFADLYAPGELRTLTRLCEQAFDTELPGS